MKIKRHSGFTLIELMIVVAIIGILAAIAIPKFSTLIAKGHEATTKGNLGAIRSALSVYYGDSEGFYPIDNLNSLVVGIRYLNQIPVVLLPNSFNSIGHPGSLRGVVTGDIPGVISDVGDGVSGWVYDNDESDDAWGHALVNCTHSDVSGILWTSF